MSKRRWLVATFLLGLAGTGLFFPMRLGIHQTNPFQFFFAHDDCSAHTPAERARCPLHRTAANSTVSAHAQLEREVELFLLRRYLFPYGFLWWLSLATVAWSICESARHRRPVRGKALRSKEEQERGV